MKFQFFGSFLLIASIGFGQQRFSVDSLSISQNEEIRDSLPALDLDSLPTLKSSKVIDSLPIVEVDSLGLDSIPKVKDSLKVGKPKPKAKKKRKPVRRRYIEIDTLALINNYKVYFEDGREFIVDTTLTIEKEYKFNFLRRDYFELLPLPNVAQGFTKMGYDFLNQELDPSMGARINQFGFFESKEMPYFEVPTPLTELFFRTTFEQGELVDALVTVNTSPKLNFMVSYKGLRSLGNYLSSRSNGGQFRSSINFNDANNRYQMRSHFVAQTRENQVNGGLNEDSIYFFENAPYYAEVGPDGNAVLDENGDIVEIFYDGFLDRSRLGNNMRGTSILSGRRFYLGQTYKLKQNPSDSLKPALKLGNRFTYETRFYDFEQSRIQDDFFGTIDETVEDVTDRMDIKRFTNETFIETNLPFLGKTKAGVQFKRWDYAHGRTDTSTATSYLGQEVNQIAIQLDWDNNYKEWYWGGKVHHALLNTIQTRHYELNAQKKFFDDWQLTVGTQYRSQPQNFNFYQYESDYVNLNWDQTDLKNTNRFSLHTKIGHPKWVQLQAEWHRIENFTYFRSTTRLVRWGKELQTGITQSQDQLEYLKLRLYNQLTFGKFSLTNTLQYQKVNQIEAERPTGELGEPLLLNVPEWITRNTFAFSSELFNNALYLQTGFHFQFFTAYYADAIHSVLGEYVNQNNTKIGEYPRVDFFVNAKISQTRVFVKVEHLNNSVSGYRYYAAPFYPYRDLSIRFGLVWNFFQ